MADTRGLFDEIAQRVDAGESLAVATIFKTRKSFGAIGQPNPNNGSGIDKDGVIMIDRILAQQPRFEGRTKERLANVEPSITTVLEHEDLQ